jgi:hypothetical protein
MEDTISYIVQRLRSISGHRDANCGVRLLATTRQADMLLPTAGRSDKLPNAGDDDRWAQQTSDRAGWSKRIKVYTQLHAASSPTAIGTVSGNNEWEINDVSASWRLVPLAVTARSSGHWKKSSEDMKKTGTKSFCAWSLIFYCVKLHVKVKFVHRMKRLWSRDQELHNVIRNIKTEIDELNGRAVSIEVRRRGLIMTEFLVSIFLTAAIARATKHRVPRFEWAWFFFPPSSSSWVPT